MLKKISTLLLLLTLVACGSTTKEINKEASKIDPMTKEEVITTVKFALDENTEITKEEKERFLKVARKNFDKREALRFKTDQLLTLLIDKASDKNYSTYKLQKVAKQIKKNEHKIVDLKMEMLKELRIFAKK